MLDLDFTFTRRMPILMGTVGTSSHGVSSAEQQSSASVQNEAARTLDRLKSTVGAVIHALPQPVKRGADLARALDIDSVLAWNLFRLSTVSDPLAGAPFVPGGGTLKHFLSSAEQHGVPHDLVTEVSRAFSEYKECIARHAPDRMAFNAMIRGIHGEDTHKEDLKHRRAAYRAQRHLYGVHAEAKLVSTLIRPTPGALKNTELMDLVKIDGYQRILRTRQAATLISESTVRVGQAGKNDPRVKIWQPLDPDPDHPDLDLSLMREFCSNPLPEIEKFEDVYGQMSVEAHSSGLGSQGASTFYFGGICRGIDTAFEPGQHIHTFFTTVVNPCEVLIRDIWLHRDVWPGTKPYVEIFRRLMGESTLRDSNLLPFKETVVEMGKGAYCGRSPNIPQYPEMLSSVSRKLGWNLDEFRLFRCQIEYPLLFSIVRMVFPQGEDQ